LATKDNSFISRIVRAFKKPAEDVDIEKLVSERVTTEINKVTSGEVLRFSPRGIVHEGEPNRKNFPIGISAQTLRDFADYYPIARSCIEFRKSQITHLDWSISPIEITDETVQDEKNIKNSKELKSFFKYPTGKKDSSFTNWIKQLLEDLLVIDAVAIAKKFNRRGDIIGYLPVDASTIELILEQDGTLPEPPQFAYLQRVNGREQARLTTEEMIYSMMTPRTHSVYGFAPMESLIITISTALKLQAFNLGYLQEGNVPEGFVSLPRDIASSRDQLKEWQDAWDSMLSGDPRFQRKLKFLPEGMKYEPTLKPSDMTFERFEKWLLQCTCSSFGLHPSSIGFNFDVNRSTSETAWEVGRERGLFPTALFLKEILDKMIQDDLGQPDLQFVWTNINPTNRVEEAEVVKTLVNNGLMSIDEWRLGEGLKPIGIKDPFLMTPVGPIFVKDLVAQSEAGQQPVAPYKPTTNSSPTGDAKNLPITSQAKLSIEEMRKWKRAALNDFKDGKSPRDFKTDSIEMRTFFLIKQELAKAKSKDDIYKVFEPYLKENKVAEDGLFRLYNQINEILEDNGESEKPIN